MDDAKFFRTLNGILGQQREFSDLSRKTLISANSLRDLQYKEDEWYAVVPLYKLRFLCSILEIDFEDIFSIPTFSEVLTSKWKSAYLVSIDEMKRTLYMNNEFFEFLRGSYRVLNLYPLQWTVDVANAMNFDWRELVSILFVKD